MGRFESQPASRLALGIVLTEGFYGKVAQSDRVALAGLAKGDDMFGHNYCCRVISTCQSKLVQRAFERLNQDSGVCGEIAILAVAD
jgi:hypothetical protein